MKKRWKSYQSKLGHENKNSIANDEASLLAERLEFFVPKLLSLFKPEQWVMFLSGWALFLTLLQRSALPTWVQFVQYLVVDLAITALTVLPAIIVVDYLRPSLKQLNTINAGARIVMIFSLCAIFAQICVILAENAFGLASYSIKQLLVETTFTALIVGGFTFVFLWYCSHRHQQLVALKLAFDQKLTSQNDLIKARIAPHFFFNTINTLVSLIESNPARASELLQHISALFRASFSGSKEISFEEEMALCEHYLAIESCRLADKLQVQWQVPDDDTMYDMVITALTLQRVLEQMLLHVVEMTTETIFMSITVTWSHHRVTIQVVVQLPTKTLFIKHNLNRQIDFEVQEQRLQVHFGQSAYIQSQINPSQIETIISYPLHDAGL